MCGGTGGREGGGGGNTREGGRFEVEDIIDELVERDTDKRRVACSTLIEHASQCPHIRDRRMDRPILEELRRHVAWRPSLGLTKIGE